MELIYRLLGLTSTISQRLSRIRINFVPINLGLGFLVTAAAFGGLAMTVEALTNDRKPVKSTVPDVFAERNPQRFVTLSGELQPEYTLEEVRRRKYSSDASDSTSTTLARYFLLLDKATKQGVLVQVDPNEDPGDKPHAYTTTGMVTAPETELASELASVTAEAARSGIHIDSKHLVKQGAEPAALGSSLLLFALGGVGACLFWVSFAKKYVIFRPEAEIAATTGAGTPATQMIVLGTGLFTLDNGDRQRYLCVPCMSLEMENGDAGFVCNADASSSFMGVTTSKRQGYWLMAVRRDGSVRFSRGRQYAGLSAHSALKIEFNDGVNGGRATGILCFDSDADRDSMIAYLSSPGILTRPTVYDHAVAAPPPAVPAAPPATSGWDI